MSGLENQAVVLDTVSFEHTPENQPEQDARFLLSIVNGTFAVMLSINENPVYLKFFDREPEARQDYADLISMYLETLKKRGFNLGTH